MPHALAADGTPLWYTTHGTGPLVLLVPGQSLTHTMWDDVWPVLARTHRVVLVDPRGTGRSRSLGPTPLTTQLLADDLARVLDQLAGERAHVVGFSMGGRVAQAFALRPPDRLASLVLVATGPGRGHEVARPQAATHALLTADRDALLGYFLTPDYLAAHPEAAARVLPDVPRATTRAHFAASRAHGVWDQLPQISAPTLVLHGADDELTPPGSARLLAERIPGARLAVVPGRHGVLPESPEALRLLQGWLAEHP